MNNYNKKKLIIDLKKEALMDCYYRGHEMGDWQNAKFLQQSDIFYCECWLCNMQVIIDVEPPPNGIQISGEAVATNCPEEEENELQKM